MTNWIMSANPTVFDHEAAFNKNGFIDWNQTRNFSVGDIVYIYCSKPVSRVMYMVEVEMVNMTYSQVVESEEWWKIPPARKKRYMRLRLLSCIDSEELSLSNLQKNGMKYAPQSPSIVKEDLQEYLDRFFGTEEQNGHTKKVD